MKTLLVVISLIALSAVIGAVVIGKRTFDGTVVDKPYERGIAWDATQKEREESGWKVAVLTQALKQGDNEIVISVMDRENRPLTEAEVFLTVSRPSSASYDRTCKMAVNERGQFRSEIGLPLYGHWDAKVSVSHSGKKITFDNKIFAQKAK